MCNLSRLDFDCDVSLRSSDKENRELGERLSLAVNVIRDSLELLPKKADEFLHLRGFAELEGRELKPFEKAYGEFIADALKPSESFFGFLDSLMSKLDTMRSYTALETTKLNKIKTDFKDAELAFQDIATTLKTGVDSYASSDVNLAELVNAQSAELKRDYPGITIDLTLDPNLPASIKTSKVLLGSIIRNILENACEELTENQQGDRVALNLSRTKIGDLSIRSENAARQPDKAPRFFAHGYTTKPSERKPGLTGGIGLFSVKRAAQILGAKRDHISANIFNGKFVISIQIPLNP